MRARVTRFVAAAAFLMSAACGGGNPGSPSPPPAGSAAVVTIAPSGVSPVEVTVSAGSRVTFVNNDTRPHNMTSDPHPDHTDCPAINQAGLLMPGQRRETGNLIDVRTCGYHDHDDDQNNRWKGRLIVR